MKKVYRPGEVAEICHCSPRQVQTWFEEGMLRGYKLPGSGHRRILGEDLLRFLKEHGMPLGDLADEPSRV